MFGFGALYHYNMVLAIASLEVAGAMGAFEVIIDVAGRFADAAAGNIV